MKSIFSIKPFCVLFFIFVSFFLKSQNCGTCTVNILITDTSSYTVNNGQIFCIDSVGTFAGTLTLNGGTVCNKGNFSPKAFTFTSGTFINKNNSRLNSSITIGSNRTINNNVGAVLNIKGTLTLSGGIISNNGIFNLDGNFQNNSGTFTNNSIINCEQLNGNNSVTNNGVINQN